MVEQTQARMEDATDKMQEGAQELKDAVTEKATNMYNEYMEQGCEMIRAHPYRSLLIAFGVGALAGLLLFRRSE